MRKFWIGRAGWGGERGKPSSAASHWLVSTQQHTLNKGIILFLSTPEMIFSDFVQHNLVVHQQKNIFCLHREEYLYWEVECGGPKRRKTKTSRVTVGQASPDQFC